MDDASKCLHAEMMFAADVKISKRLTEFWSMIKDFQEEAKPQGLTFEGNQKLLD